MQRQYRNVFAEIGFSQEEIKEKLEKSFEEIFYDSECFYHCVGEDMAYFEDTGNNDARTEGMSYAMMMCVQMDRKEEFDRLWKWKKYVGFSKISDSIYSGMRIHRSILSFTSFL